MTQCALALAVLIGLASSVAVAEEKPPAEESAFPTLTGLGVALDGDTLHIQGHGAVRLWGIDAPEMRDWPAGAHARATLDSLIKPGEPFTCSLVAKDRYKRDVGICHQRDRPSLGYLLLAAGQAVVYRRFTAAAESPPLQARAQLYDLTETQARQARRGIWRAWAEPPRAVRD